MNYQYFRMVFLCFVYVPKIKAPNSAGHTYSDWSEFNKFLANPSGYEFGPCNTEVSDGMHNLKTKQDDLISDIVGKEYPIILPNSTNNLMVGRLVYVYNVLQFDIVDKQFEEKYSLDCCEATLMYIAQYFGIFGKDVMEQSDECHQYYEKNFELRNNIFMQKKNFVENPNVDDLSNLKKKDIEKVNDFNNDGVKQVNSNLQGCLENCEPSIGLKTLYQKENEEFLEYKFNYIKNLIEDLQDEIYKEYQEFCKKNESNQRLGYKQQLMDVLCKQLYKYEMVFNEDGTKTFANKKEYEELIQEELIQSLVEYFIDEYIETIACLVSSEEYYKPVTRRHSSENTSYGICEIEDYIADDDTSNEISYTSEDPLEEIENYTN
ncbi:hypothetical protein COBT_001624 [Conglomerata obtusa]